MERLKIINFKRISPIISKNCKTRNKLLNISQNGSISNDEINIINQKLNYFNSFSTKEKRNWFLNSLEQEQNSNDFKLKNNIIFPSKNKFTNDQLSDNNKSLEKQNRAK